MRDTQEGACLEQPTKETIAAITQVTSREEKEKEKWKEERSWEETKILLEIYFKNIVNKTLSSLFTLQQYSL